MTELMKIAYSAFCHSSSLHRQMGKLFVPSVVRVAEELHNCFQGNHKVILFGNGGSAADAQHIAAEFVGRLQENRDPLPAIALTTDTSILTSISNDFGFDQIFSRQIQAIGCEGDIAIAISTSGNSINITNGVEAAKAIGMRTIGITGKKGGRLAETADIALVVPTNKTARIQECHITIGHIICEIVEFMLFPELNKVAKNTPEEKDMFTGNNGKIVDLKKLISLRKLWREQDMTVVWTNGCFDLLHVGHIRNLEEARRLGDVLIVGINDDLSVQSLKGNGHPFQTAADRAEILSALESVDYVFIFKGLTPIDIISQIKPDIHCKGADYAPPDGKPIPEATVVNAYGGKIEFIPLVPGKSTSALFRKIRSDK